MVGPEPETSAVEGARGAAGGQGVGEFREEGEGGGLEVVGDGGGERVRVALGEGGEEFLEATGSGMSVPSPSRSNSRKTAGVDRPRSAMANTQWKAPPTSRGVSCSPRPMPRAAPPTRLNGTSLPNSAQMSRSSSREAPVPHSASQATSAPAPSALPPAMPPATGMSLAMWRCTSGLRP